MVSKSKGRGRKRDSKRRNRNSKRKNEENKIYARVCSYCMQTIGIEHKVKVSSVGNWVIVFVVVVVLFIFIDFDLFRLI